MIQTYLPCTQEIRKMRTWLEQNAVSLIGYAITLLGFIIGAKILAWQLNRQHESALKLQRDNAREELKLKLHEILVQKIREAEHAIGRAHLYIFMIPLKVESYQRQLAEDSHQTPIKERTSEFLKLHNEASTALSGLIQEFESWSIAFPGLQIFQTALNSANHDARKAFPPLFTALLPTLPFDPQEEAPSKVPRPIIPRPLSNEELRKLNELADCYTEAMLTVESYVSDLLVESQNNLLSGLFDRKIPLRVPLDPKSKVITTDPKKAEQLLKYFENETAWGKDKAKTEKDVIEVFRSKHS
jgi:hypothetical protein